MKKIALMAGIVSLVFITKLSAQTTDNTTTKKINNQAGIDLYNAHKYKEAIVEFNKSIKENPNDGEAYYYRGMSKMHDSQKGYCKDLEESLKLKYTTSADIYYYGCNTHSKE